MSTEIICKDCGAIIDVENENYLEIDGEYVCKDCMDDYVQCEECGEWCSIEDVQWVETEDAYICQDCLDSEFTQCEDCGGYHRIDDMYLVTNSYGDDYYICEHCRDYDYYTCASCGNLFHTDNLRYHEGHGCDYCENCYPYNENIMEYHDFNDWQPYTVENRNESILKGFELEVSGDDCDFVAGTLKDVLGDFTVYEEDGSVDGFEIITNPFSRQYWVKNSEKFKEVFKILNKYGYDNCGCGLHVHVNRKQLETDNLFSDDIIDNIILIMETFKEELTKFSRRTQSDLSHWASFLTDDGEELIFEELKKKKSRKGRYCALNITNSNTVEFRIFKGTLDYNELMATLELVDNIVDIARSNKLENLTWNDIVSFGGSFIADYVNDCNIESDKKLHIIKKEDSCNYQKFKVGDIVTISENYSHIGYNDMKVTSNDKFTIVKISNYYTDQIAVYNPNILGHNGDLIGDIGKYDGHLWYVDKSYLNHIIEPFKTINNLNIGDRVLVRDDLIIDKIYGNDVFVNGMVKGELVTVSTVGSIGFRIKESRFNYTSEMCIGKVAHENISI